MYFKKEMKHNAFVQVRIPTPKEVFGRVGTLPVPSSGYTGDESFSAVGTRKTDQLADEERLYKAYCAEQSRKDADSTSE